MYNIALATIDDNPQNVERLSLFSNQGYYIDTIEGLTGIESKIETQPNVNAAGESYVGHSIHGKTLTIKGKILDEQTEKKQALLDFCKPARELWLEIYTKDTSPSSTRLVAYRKTRVRVQVTPIISQTKHSRFSIVLKMPYPFWLAADKTEYELSLGLGFINIFGDVEPDYEIQFTIPSSSESIFVLHFYYGLSAEDAPRRMTFDFTKTTAGQATAGDIVKVWRENGRLRCTINDDNAINIIDLNSTLWTLPLGTHLAVSFSRVVNDATVSYYPAYSGVIVDGV